MPQRLLTNPRQTVPRCKEILTDGARIAVMLVIDRLFFRLLFIAFIILMTVMVATAPMPGEILLYLLLYLMMSLTAVMPNMHPARRVPNQEGHDGQEAR